MSKTIKVFLICLWIFMPIFVYGISAEPFTLAIYSKGEIDNTIVHQIPEEVKKAPSRINKLGYNRGYYNVSTPELTVFPAIDQSKPTPAIVVFPGGGFTHITYDKEGTMIADWLNSLGITAIVVKYRTLPKGIHRNSEEGKKLVLSIVDDCIHAVSIVNTNAAEWNIDPDKIGIMGFSAGGRICASIITQTHSHHPIDYDNYKPDFCCLVYPGLSEQQIESVNADLPPTFITVARDDKVTPANKTIDLYSKMLIANVPSEMHIFMNGAHGFGIYKDRGVVSNWPLLFENWMDKLEITSHNSQGL